MALNWSEIMPDILVAIGKEIHYYEDLLTFAQVCSSWKTAADDCLSEFRGFCQFPCLLLPERPEEEGEREERRGKLMRRDFFFLRSRNVGGVLMPMAAGKRRRCLPTSHGWILTYDKDLFCVPTLLHPFSGQEIALPKLSTFRDDLEESDNYYTHIIKKVALSSSDPSSPNFLVMVIWDGMHRLGFCRPGDVSWAVTELDERFSFFDIIYHNGRLYALNYDVEIFVSDVHGPDPTKLQLLKVCPDKCISFQWVYIVKSDFDDDTFFIVFRANEPYFEGLDDRVSFDDETIIDEDEDEDVEEEECAEDGDVEEEESAEEYLSDDVHGDESDEENGENEIDENGEDDRKEKFLIFEFSSKDRDRWVELEDLGGVQALFLGHNTSFAIKTNIGGCIKPDCIYFTDDVQEKYLFARNGGGKDMGVYNLRERTIEPHFDLWRSRSFVAPPSWVFNQTESRVSFLP